MSADSHGELGVRLLHQARELQTSAMERRRDRSAQALPVYRQALEHFRAAAALAPGSSQTHRFCALVQSELGELDAACASFAQAYHLAPTNAEVAAEYASSLQSAGNTAAAVTIYEDALRQHPAHAGLHAGFALTLLGAADFARGWDEYEWRLKVPQAGIERPFPFARWQGEPLGGRTLLVYTEQGVGDEIMFASCFDELIAAAGHCVLEASTRLVPLFERAFPKATVFARNLARMPDWSRLPHIDYCIAAGSVPRFLRRTREAFPRREAYLRPDPARLEYWKKRLAATPGPRIGLAWTGGLPGTLRAARSLSLRDLAPLVGAFRATYLALEFLDCGAEVEAFNRESGGRIEWWPQAVSSLDDTAAMLEALDLVITVTTATAHLAGALGRPTWALVPSVSSWRYLWAGDAMPWYSCVRVLRGAGSRPAVVALALQRLKQCYSD